MSSRGSATRSAGCAIRCRSGAAALRLAKDAGRGDFDLSAIRRPDHRGGGRLAESEGRRCKAGKPWVLFVSLVCPHFPLIARPEWYDLYPEDKVPVPALYEAAERAPDHPVHRGDPQLSGL